MPRARHVDGGDELVSDLGDAAACPAKLVIDGLRAFM
jgi:hypothetical protein